MAELAPDIPIYENYGGYRPPFNAAKTVSKLLKTVPSQYLVGLGSIVLSSQAILPRKVRRKALWSRGRKVRTFNIRGYYRRTWKGQPPFIELYVDKISAGLPQWAIWIPMITSALIAEVLFHEIGHHIHYAVRPEFSEKEDVAGKWGKRLTKNAVRKLYWYFWPLLWLLKKTLRIANRLKLS